MWGTAVDASPSLSDSSLLLSESSSCPLVWAWMAAGPALPRGAGGAPFPGESTWAGAAVVALTWGSFPEGFAWSERNSIRGGSLDGGREETQESGQG